MNNHAFDSLNKCENLQIVQGIKLAALVETLKEEQKAQYQSKYMELAKEYLKALSLLTDEERESVERSLGLKCES